MFNRFREASIRKSCFHMLLSSFQQGTSICGRLPSQADHVTLFPLKSFLILMTEINSNATFIDTTPSFLSPLAYFSRTKTMDTHKKQKKKRKTQKLYMFMSSKRLKIIQYHRLLRSLIFW